MLEISVLGIRVLLMIDETLHMLWTHADAQIMQECFSAVCTHHGMHGSSAKRLAV